MPNLGDFLGHLMAEVTIARMHADVESVRIAEFYATHPLLATMPIPRFRLPTIEIDLPVVIKDAELQGQKAAAPPSAREMKESLNKVVGSFLKIKEVGLKAGDRKALDESVEKALSRHIQPHSVTMNISQIAEEISDVIANTLTSETGPLKKVSKELVKADMKKEVRSGLVGLYKAPPRMEVLVRTSEIRELAPNDIATRIHIKLNEDAIEWTTSESEGKIKDQLIPE